MNKFLSAYIKCALWSSSDGYDSLDDKYSIKDISPQTMAKMELDCQRFKLFHGSLLKCAKINDTKAGHNFWLSRNRHGAGFFDGNYDEAEFLQKAAQDFGPCVLCVGDDKKIYII